MAARLGIVLYWTFCALAALLAAVGVWIVLATKDTSLGFMVFVFAPVPVVWLIGRACRYILADE